VKTPGMKPLLAALLLSAAPVRADLILVQHVDGSGQSGDQTIRIKGDKAQNAAAEEELEQARDREIVAQLGELQKLDQKAADHLDLKAERLRDVVNVGLHLARNTTHFVGQFSWALAVTLLPFATVFALEFTTPAWVALLAALILGERMTKSRVGSVVLGFLGVMVIVRPGLSSFQPNALLVLFAAFTFAISLIVTKQLTVRVSTFAIIFWMNLIQLPMALAWPSVLAATGGPPAERTACASSAAWL